MTQVELPTEAELTRLSQVLARTFISRWDRYPVQLPEGQYVSVKEPLNSGHIMAHLKGEMTLGAYVLNPESEARYVVLDADTEEDWERMTQAATELEEADIPSYLERSRRGGHIWLWLKKPVPASEARQFGRGVMQQHQLKEVELYPKQDELRTGPGSLIRLPFGVHRKSGQRYGFYTPQGEPLASTLRDQLIVFAEPLRVSQAGMEGYMRFDVKPTIKPRPRPRGAPQEKSGTVSERIKASITVSEFVSQYIDLTSRGTGLCPLHDDHQQSFSVHFDENFWHCFAGCGGGSVVDFYMQYKDTDFTTAVKELAEMLLDG